MTGDDVDPFGLILDDGEPFMPDPYLVRKARRAFQRMALKAAVRAPVAAFKAWRKRRRIVRAARQLQKGRKAGR